MRPYAKQNHTARRFSAEGLPVLRPATTSKETFWLSLSPCIPACSTARPCANRQKNPPSVASLTLTTLSERLKPSMGAAVRDHRNAVRDQSEPLSAINRNTRPQSPESATGAAVSVMDGQRKARAASPMSAIGRRHSICSGEGGTRSRGSARACRGERGGAYRLRGGNARRRRRQ